MFEADFTPFVIRLEQYVGEFQRRYSELSSDPKRLLAKNEYRSAVISASILLEAELREKFRYRMKGYTRPLGLKNLLDLARDKGYSDFDTYASIREFISVRNQLIHTNKNIPQKQALTIVVKIEKVLKDIASAMESEYYQVKIDDPDRDSRLIENNLMRELCEKGFLCSKEWSAFRVLPRRHLEFVACSI